MSWREEKPGQFRVWSHPYGGNLHPIESLPFDRLEDARRCAWIEQLHMGRMADYSMPIRFLPIGFPFVRDHLTR